MSLFLELGTVKDEVYSLQSQASHGEGILEGSRGDLCLWYGCYVFKHNIYGDCLEVLEGMLDSANSLPLEFFVNPGCPPIQATSDVLVIEVPKTAKELAEITTAEDHTVAEDHAAAKDHGRL